MIAWTEAGLYCHSGRFHIDPHRPVERAVITHAHSDHARRGCQEYITARSGLELLRIRLGRSIRSQGVEYRKPIPMGDVSVSFHPAGHILGSAQIRIEHRGDVWVATGDYKRGADPSCEPFEVVKCDTLITEATFGTPKYIWPGNMDLGKEIAEWWDQNAGSGTNSLIHCYSLGKTQRILALLRSHAKRPVLLHSTMLELTAAYAREGVELAPHAPLPDLSNAPTLFGDKRLEGELILAPPSWLRDKPETFSKLGKVRKAFASGWVLDGGRSHELDHGFLISDHADWNELNLTIEQSRATRVFVQHRSNGALVRHLRGKGLDAYAAEELAPERYIRLPERNLSLFGGL